MKNIAIFASGSGTNAENIARYFANSENVNVAVVLSNNRNVGVHGRVNKLGVPSFVFSREEFIAGVPILEKLAEYDVCLIVLAGFMNKISDVILQAFPGKIVNIHPALLPKYGGKGMYGMHVHEAVVRLVSGSRVLLYIILMSIMMRALSSSRLLVRYYLRIRRRR